MGLGLRTVINSLLPPLLQYAIYSRQPVQKQRFADCLQLLPLINVLYPPCFLLALLHFLVCPVSSLLLTYEKTDGLPVKMESQRQQLPGFSLCSCSVIWKPLSPGWLLVTGHPDPLQQHDHGLTIISLIAFCSLLSSSSLQDFNSSTLTVSPGCALEALHRRM